MDEIILNANRRTVIGKQVNALRRAGNLPAVLYGRRIDPLPIQLNLKEASRVLEKLSPSALIVVEVDGDKHFALVREKQRDPLLGSLRHVDFQAVLLTEKVKSNVNLHLVGVAPAVETYFGIVVTNIERVEVECLPRALPDRIDVELSGLKEIGDAIHVRDLVMPKGVEVLNDPEELVVVITAPIAEEVIVAEEVAGILAGEPEVIERGKREEEEE